MPVSRQNTGRSDARRSLRTKLTQPLESLTNKRAPSPKLYTWKVGMYNGLTWPKLKAHLESLFPDMQFREDPRSDKWIVKVPVPYTTDRKNAILQLRDDNSRRKRSLTPELELPTESDEDSEDGVDQHIEEATTAAGQAQAESAAGNAAP